MEAGRFSASINFLLIPPFIPLLNSSTKGLPSYPLPLATLLNFCTNSSIFFPPCSSFLNSAAFADSYSPSPNSFFKLIKNSSANSYSTSSDSNSSITFSFHTSVDPPYIYKRIHCTCFSTVTSLNFILKNSLHAVINPPTFSASLLKIAGLATSMWGPMLDPIVVLSVPSVPIPSTLLPAVLVAGE